MKAKMQKAAVSGQRERERETKGVGVKMEKSFVMVLGNSLTPR